MPTPPPRHPLRALVAAGILLLGTSGAAGPATVALATTAPPTVDATDTDGSELTITPAAVRTPDGRAELDVVLGAEAPADLLVTPQLAPPDVAADGTVAIGAGEVDGTVTRGARLRPGERLRVVVDRLTGPVLVVAAASPADAGRETTAAAPVAPAALVLPGAVGAAPTVALAADATRVEVRADAPVLVSVTVAGRERTTFPDRLVLPDQPLTLPVVQARWPLPTEVAVTDETGRTVRSSTGTVPIVLAAGVLVAVAGLALVAVRRRVRP